MPNDPSDVAFDEGWEALLETATLVDVRGAGELEADGSLPDALHIPLRMGDAPGARVAAAAARAACVHHKALVWPGQNSRCPHVQVGARGWPRARAREQL